MGMFDSFLGKGGAGYTSAQRTGLQRSNQIKKKRKEEERAFTREQEATKIRSALTERRMMEAGQTHRTAMTTAAGIQEQNLSNVGQMARQRLTGAQGREAATSKAIREANAKSMEYGRSLTKGDIKYERDIELQKLKNKGALGTLLDESQGSTTGGESQGGQKEYTFAQFASLPHEEKLKYMDYTKKNNPKKFFDFARQYKLLNAPEKESGRGASSSWSTPIYQSNNGTFTNY